MDVPQTDSEWASVIESITSTVEADLAGSNDQPSISVSSLSDAQLANYIDHTLLKPDAATHQILEICDQALKHHFRTVCVREDRIERCRKHFRGTHVGRPAPPGLPAIAAVIGFPEGTYTTTTKCAEAHAAVQQGATELDMVLNYELLKAGNYTEVYHDVKAVRETIDKPIQLSFSADNAPLYGSREMPTGSYTQGAGSITLKVILETSQLTSQQIIAGSLISIRAGADFIKTSTGFRGGGATVEDVQRMGAVAEVEARSSSRKRVKVKASGGIRSLDDCLKMINAGAERIGASAGVTILKEFNIAETGGSSTVSPVSAVSEVTTQTY